MAQSKGVKMVARWWLLVVLFGSCLFSLTASDVMPELQYTNQDDWVDPHDMLNYDTGTKTMRNVQNENQCQAVEEELSVCISERESCQSSVQECNKRLQTEKSQECVCEQSCVKERDGKYESDKQAKRKNVDCEAPYFKQFIRSIFNQMTKKRGIDQSLNFEYQVQLSTDDWLTLDKFIHTDTGSIYDVHGIVSNMVKRVDRSDKPVNTWRQWIEDLFGTDYDTIVTSVVMVLAITCFVVFVVSSEMISRCSWWKQIIRAFILLFVISVPWNWMHLYKEAVAKKYTIVTKDIPDQCKPGGSTVASGIQEWFYSMFTFSGDQCADYHQALMVDPILEVAPTQALVVTISKFVLKPLEHLGEALGKFFHGFFKDMPMQVWPIATFILIVVIILMLIMLCGYSIKFPFYGGIEAPKREKLMKEEWESIKQAKEQKKEIEELKKKIQEIKDERLMITEGERCEPVAVQQGNTGIASLFGSMTKKGLPVEAEDDPMKSEEHYLASAITSSEEKKVSELQKTSDPHQKTKPNEGLHTSRAGSGAERVPVMAERFRKNNQEKPDDIQASLKVLDAVTEEKDRLGRMSGDAGVKAPSMAVEDNTKGEISLATQRKSGQSAVEDIHIESSEVGVREPIVESKPEEESSRNVEKVDNGDGDAKTDPKSVGRVEDLEVKSEDIKDEKNDAERTVEARPTEKYKESTTVGHVFPDLPPQSSVWTQSSVLTESMEVIPQASGDSVQEVEVLETGQSRNDSGDSHTSDDDFVVLKKESMESEGDPDEDESGRLRGDSSIISLD